MSSVIQTSSEPLSKAGSRLSSASTHLTFASGKSSSASTANKLSLGRSDMYPMHRSRWIRQLRKRSTNKCSFKLYSHDQPNRLSFYTNRATRSTRQMSKENEINSPRTKLSCSYQLCFRMWTKKVRLQNRRPLGAAKWPKNRILQPLGTCLMKMMTRLRSSSIV